MFGSKLVIEELRRTIARLERELEMTKAEKQKLLDRLLHRELGPAPAPPGSELSDVKALERMLASTDVFGDDEISEELEIIDNRKEGQSEFAS